MKPLTLATNNRDQLRQWLTSESCVVACLCAAWCDTCTAYKGKFEELAALHPHQRFVWIDIEDQADLVGELDISNFPTLLIQQHDVVSFFGTVQPDLQQANRLLRIQLEKNRDDLEAEALTSSERMYWQRECNLRLHLENN